MAQILLEKNKEFLKHKIILVLTKFNNSSYNYNISFRAKPFTFTTKLDVAEYTLELDLVPWK